MKHGGYTLIEILIVMFIISIVTSVALLSISRNENQQMQSFANEMAQMVTLAEEQAMLEPSVLGLAFAAHSFQFAALQPNSHNNGNTWLLLDDAILGKHLIPENLQVDIKIEGISLTLKDKPDTINPHIIISTNGDITPFTIYVGKKGQKPRYAITGDADGNVTNKLL